MKTAHFISIPEGSTSELAGTARRCLLVCMAFSVPFIFLLPGLGDREVAIAASDVVAAVGCLILVRNLLAGQLHLPLGTVACLSIAALLLTQFLNCDSLIAARGAPVAFAEIPKALLLWLHFYVVVNLIETRQDFLVFIKSWIVSGVVVSLAGIGGSLAFQYAGIENDYSNNFRAQGTLGDANLYAAHLGLSFILVLFYTRLTGRFSKWLIPALIIYSAGIILSASRGSTLSFIICLNLLWLSVSSFQLRLATVSVLSALALLLIWSPPSAPAAGSSLITERLSTITLSLNDEGAADRRGLWESAWAEFRQSPLVGVGRAGFTPLDQPELTKASAIHNTYLSMACETGLIGFLLQMIFFVGCVTALLAAPMWNSALRVSRRILVLGLILIGLCGITISIEAYRGLWVLLGIMDAYRRLYAGENWQETSV